MNCFNHQEIAASGICKNCQKGICHDCCTLVEGSVSCKGSCENQVLTLNRIITKSSSSLGTTETAYKRNAFFNVLIGLIFSGFGIYALANRGNVFSYFLLAFGVVSIGYGISQYFSGKEYGKDKDV